jgi:Uma2 family endonuclease
MSTIPPREHPETIDYPESDGKPMADNTKQLNWIYTLFGNIAALFHANENVFVSGNQNWYPVQGHPEIVCAPDVYVVFGRPKGHRGSYKQWEENDLPMTVVFEVLSPKNTLQEMADKQAFYSDYGVEEYYIYDPDVHRLQVFIRHGTELRQERKVQNFVSPRLGIRFDLSGDDLVVYLPDGQPFLTFEELSEERKLSDAARKQSQEHAELAKLEAEKAKLETEKAHLDAERARVEAGQARLEAEKARVEAEQARLAAAQAELQATKAQLDAEQTRKKLARLSELSRKARRQEASAEELAELDRLDLEVNN